MAHTQPHTPLSKLINARLSELSISRTELMKRLGYANPASGLRRFDEFIATGQVTTHLLKGLPDVLGLDAANLDAAAAATRQQIADAEEAATRERFRPHILVLTARQDGKHIPAFMQAWFWGIKVLGLQDGFDSWASSKQVGQAAHIVRQHYRETGGGIGHLGDDHRLSPATHLRTCRDLEHRWHGSGRLPPRPGTPAPHADYQGEAGSGGDFRKEMTCLLLSSRIRR